MKDQAWYWERCVPVKVERTGSEGYCEDDGEGRRAQLNGKVEGRVVGFELSLLGEINDPSASGDKRMTVFILFGQSFPSLVMLL